MNPVRRKLAIATWSAPSEGNIYGKLTVDVTRTMARLDEVRETTGNKLTITHVVGWAIGQSLAAAPGLNGYLRLGTFLPHEHVDLSFLVAADEGKDLAKVKVEAVETLTVSALADRLGAGASRVRTGKDENFEKNKSLIRMLPTWLIRPLLRLTGWLTASLGLDMPALGLEKFPFGACMITSVGMFGLDEGFAPQTPFARTPVLVLIGAVRDGVAVVDGTIQVRKLLTITATIDHRFLDGAQGGALAKTLRGILEDPDRLQIGERAG